LSRPPLFHDIAALPDRAVITGACAFPLPAGESGTT